MVVLPSSQSLRALIELFDARKLLILYQSIVQTKDTSISTTLFVQILNCYKWLSYRRIRTQHDGQTRIMFRSKLPTRGLYQISKEFVLPSHKWYRRLTFSTQIFRSSYYRNMTRRLKSSRKNGLNSLLTRIC